MGKLMFCNYFIFSICVAYYSEMEVMKSASRRRSRSDMVSDVSSGSNKKCSNCDFQSDVSADYHAHLLECGGVTDWDEASKKKKKKKVKKKAVEGEVKPKKEFDPGKANLIFYLNICIYPTIHFR